MPKKKNKAENEQPWTPAKWKRNTDKPKERLSGVVVTEHGGTTRSEDRKYQHDRNIQHRLDGSPVTTPSISKRRSARRAKNAAAKRARKAARAR